MSSSIYLEGGGDSKELQIRCREGFRKLLERCQLKGRMPRLYACGGRNAAFDDFKTGHATKRKAEYVAMLIDSEEPVLNHEEPWHHLKSRDKWARPAGAANDQVLLMTTCMETWVCADRETLETHFGKKLRFSALPPLTDMEIVRVRRFREVSFRPRKIVLTRIRRANARSRFSESSRRIRWRSIFRVSSEPGGSSRKSCGKHRGRHASQCGRYRHPRSASRA